MLHVDVTLKLKGLSLDDELKIPLDGCPNFT